MLFQLKIDSVKAKILELVQCWAYAFRDNNDYKIVVDTFNEMKNSGKFLLPFMTFSSLCIFDVFLCIPQLQ